MEHEPTTADAAATPGTAGLMGGTEEPTSGNGRRTSEDGRPAPEGAEDGGGTPARTGAPRRRRRGGRGRGGGAKTATARNPDTAESTDTAAESTETTAATPQRQLAKPPEPGADGSASDDADGQETGPAPATGTGRRRRRGGRGRGRKPAGAAPSSGTEGEPTSANEISGDPTSQATQREDALPDAPATGEAAAPTRSRSRTRSRGGRGRGGTKAPGTTSPETPGSEDESDTVERAPKAPKATKASKPMTLEERVASGGPTRGLRSSRSRTPRDRRRRGEATPTPPRIFDKVMVITEHGDRDQIAVLEEDVLVQHYVTRTGATSMVGNIYLGRVQNVLPGMEAAFVDVGRGRNGVLYAGEVNYTPEDIEGSAPRIEQVLKAGQAVMVQVTKDPMGGKGARLTANLSLAGRYLVLAPNQDLQGISRRLPDEERRRLKAILKKFKPEEHGVIVRTAAEGATDEALIADLQRLLQEWKDIQARAKKGKAPHVLYEEPELTVRVVRDLFTDAEYKTLVTDSQRVYDTVLAYARDVAPDLAAKIQLHTSKLPAFETHRIVEQIHKALDKKVWLPSGGYLFIERTEAMTIIDVNTGKSVGKTNLEETVVNTNLEAAREVARQLRLRDIGGIIVVDFIDMLLDKNKRTVEDTMREALALDKTRSQVFEIGPLGLMQVTRKRVSSGLVESFSETCPTCEGRGILINYDVN